MQKAINKIKKLGIENPVDIVYHYPSRYEFRNVVDPKNLQDDMLAVIYGTVVKVIKSKPRPGLRIMNVTIKSPGGETVDAVWFRSYHEIMQDEKICVFGKVEINQFGRKVIVTDYALLTEKGSVPNEFIGIIPVYPTVKGVTQEFIRDAVRNELLNYQKEELLSDAVMKEYRLIGHDRAVKQIHFPESEIMLKQAKRRLAFEEVYLLQCALQITKNSIVSHPADFGYKPSSEMIEQFINSLPFNLTKGQQDAWKDIEQDLNSPYPMRRLLLGDVGSGKTVIAALALLKAVESDLVGVMMAPTEILAKQHFESLVQMYKSKYKISLITGSIKQETKDAQIIVGTHALFSGDSNLSNVGLIIIDEQHRFGVEQRKALQEKAGRPDMLVMTATPIPRTLALAVYGDMDMTVIDELPAGRKPVKTYVVRDRIRLERLMQSELIKGRQCYVICPLVEESEKIDLENAQEIYGQLSQSLGNFGVGIVHGKMKPNEKEEAMTEFRNGKKKVLVSTTVVEVGVNVPNATVMAVIDADRFGLAQLHQLRGRVGRGGYESYCVLVSQPKTSTAVKRLQAMIDYSSGFDLAEMDLKIRGPGEFFGEKQSGKLDMKLASIDNIKMMEAAKRTAESTEPDGKLLSIIKDKYFKN